MTKLERDSLPVCPSKFIEEPRFNRTFTLPADTNRARKSSFTLQYADFGYRNEACPRQENVLVFFGPMTTSRLRFIGKDMLAKEHKIRIICPDKPGIGGTSPLSQKYALRVFSDAIAALIASLDIEYVSVATHSTGMIYGFDLILNHPEIIRRGPIGSCLYIGSPWITPSHADQSVRTSMKMAFRFPNLAVRFTHYFNRCSFMEETKKTIAAREKASGAVNGNSKGASISPADPSFDKFIKPWIDLKDTAAGLGGMAQEAKIAMRRGISKRGWGHWGDTDDYVLRLGDQLQMRGKKLRVICFYAEEDAYIGKYDESGPQWFNECWAHWLALGRISYRTAIVPKAGHFDIWDQEFGALVAAFDHLSMVNKGGDIALSSVPP